MWVAGLVLSAVAVAGFVLQQGDDTVITPPDRPRAGAEPGAGDSTRADQADALLDDLAEVLAQGDRGATRALAAPNAVSRAEAATLFDNVRALRIVDLDMRYVDESDSAPSAEDLERLGPQAWVGDVEVTWRLRGFEMRPSTMEVPLTFVRTADNVRLASVDGAQDEAAPLWMLERVSVERSRRVLVFATTPADSRTFFDLSTEAARTVRQVLPRWRGGLVVEVPASERQLDRVLGAEPGNYASIAAVTSTVDGSVDESSPAHILVNPQVFGRLGPDGSQIVMSHEATHVATDAATSSMPLWLLEGFADYVALAHSDLPVQLTASQVLAEVRKSGPPRQLPGPDEFDPTNKLLGSSYEAAWLACRLIADEYGETRLIDMYDAVNDGRSLPAAFSEELDTDVASFTRSWRGYLRDLAG